ncbi:MAG: FliH/SctL family protein [Myxococcota bacterium]|nr:FliH/SctL family protein [Myxococcota bacterium]
MSTDARALFAVETTIVPASFGTRRNDLESWIPRIISEDEAVPSSEGTEATDDATDAPPTAKEVLPVAEQIDIALQEQKEQLEGEFASALEEQTADAFERGQRARDEELTQMQSEVLATLEKLLSTRKQLVQAYRQEAISLATTLAHAVIGHTLEVSEDALRLVTERALTGIPTHRELIIRCHEDDKIALDRILADSTNELGDPIAYRLVVAPRVERGGLLIDFGSGNLDAQPSAALGVLEEAVRSALAGPIDMEEAILSTDDDAGEES